ncbi:MAG: hypothetical protein J2P54_07315, partial [Bradyrhizobiaceae bacterium]|nr:hypothetical protein [Bradyrhizobiaceae bacterium]
MDGVEMGATICSDKCYGNCHLAAQIGICVSNSSTSTTCSFGTSFTTGHGTYRRVRMFTYPVWRITGERDAERP